MADPIINFYDFSNMHIDLSKVSASQTVLEVFPELNHYEAYTKATDMEIRVAFCMSDPKGPFSTLKQYPVRLQHICKWYQVAMEAPGNELYESILNFKSQNVADITTQYLSSVFDHEWTSWYSNSIMYYQMMEEIRKPIDFTKESEWKQRQSIEGRADAIYKRMKDMEKILFVDEAIKKRAFENEKNKIENFAEKHAVSNSIV